MSNFSPRTNAFVLYIMLTLSHVQRVAQLRSDGQNSPLVLFSHTAYNCWMDTAVKFRSTCMWICTRSIK